VLAADYIGYREPAFVSYVASVRTKPVTGGPANLIECSTHRPNNWGAWCTSSRIIIDLYLRDTADYAKAVSIYKGWLGDRAAYAYPTGDFGDLSWQSDATKPVGINPAGATKSTYDIDGVLPDDQRRAGSFAWPPPCENYVHEALQGATLSGAILALHGESAWTWSNAALARAYRWLYGHSCPATGDDNSTPWTVNHFTGSAYPATSPTNVGKGFGFTDWLWP
jgi:hypothetical protein